MLQVELDHILPESDAYGRIREIIQHVEDEKEVYVITKDGKPAVAIISADQLVESQDTPETAQQEMPSLGLGGFSLPAAETLPAPVPTAAPAFQPVATLPPLPTPPVFSEPLPPLSGTEQFNQPPVALPVPPPTALPPLPPVPTVTAPAVPQFPPTLVTPNQAPFSFPKEDLDNASPLG